MPVYFRHYISLDGARRTQASSSIYTLYAYDFLNNNLPGLPLWYRKGLAEYYGTLVSDILRADGTAEPAAWLFDIRKEGSMGFAQLRQKGRPPVDGRRVRGVRCR